MGDEKKQGGKAPEAKKPSPFRNGLILGLVIGILLGCFIGTPSFMAPYREMVFGQVDEAKRQAMYETGKKLQETGQQLQEKAEEKPNSHTSK